MNRVCSEQPLFALIGCKRLAALGRKPPVLYTCDLDGGRAAALAQQAAERGQTGFRDTAVIRCFIAAIHRFSGADFRPDDSRWLNSSRPVSNLGLTPSPGHLEYAATQVDHAVLSLAK